MRSIYFFSMQSVVLLLLLNSSFLVFSQESTLDYRSVIDHYEKSIQNILSLQYSYNLEYEQDAIYRYHNKKTYISYHSPQSKTSNIQITKEMLIKEGQFIVVTDNKESSENDNIQIIAQNFSKNNDVPQIISLKSPCLLGFIDGSPKKINYIPKLLREYVTSAKSEIVDGQSMVHLHGSKEGLEVSAWIVPSQNYFLYRIQYKIDEKSSPGGEMISFDYQPKNFQQYDGDIWIPSDYNYDYTMLTINYEYDKNMTLVPGKLTKGNQSSSVKLKDIKVNADIPNRVFEIKTKIPNGTKVTMLDAQQIEYIWFDGKIEPKTDELMLRIARGGHRFMPGVREPRFWLIASGLCFIILGVVLKVKTYLKQRREE